MPANQSLIEDEGENFDSAAVRAETEQSIDELMSLSNETFSRWIDRFEIQPRRRALPSR